MSEASAKGGRLRRHQPARLAAAAGLAVVLAATTVRGEAGSRRPAAAATRCNTLPPAALGWYRPLPADAFELWLGRCRVQATRAGRFLAAGDYTRIGGDARRGEIVISNDLGCRGPGSEDLPTPYRYAFDGYLLTLTVFGGADNDRCPPRAQELHGRQLVKVLEGPVRIALLGLTRGSFSATGAFSDSGSFVRGRAGGVRLTLRGGKGSLVVATRRAPAGSHRWAIVRGIGSYVGLRGGGAVRSRDRSAVLTGSITNEH